MSPLKMYHDLVIIMPRSKDVNHMNMTASGALNVEFSHRKMASPINELMTADAAIQTRLSTASPRPPFVALGFEAEVLPVARTLRLVSAALAVLPVIPVTATVLPTAADVPDALGTADEEDVEDP